ncbi:MAG: LPS assembly lipoprotein LptE [Vibrionaceae bacterium]
MRSSPLLLRQASLLFCALLIGGCGFNLRGSYNLPDEIKTLSITSFDEFGPLRREMKKQLQLHDIKVVAPAKESANLHFRSESYGESTLSLYQNSRAAQKQILYTARYSVSVPQKGSYEFSTSVSRTYLDNPLTALAKSVEEEVLAKEMRIEATKQIMRQLARLTANIEEFERQQMEQKILDEQYQKESGVTIQTRFEGKEPSGKPLKNYIEGKK